MDLRRVRVFFEVAERRSFSAAASALQYTQPSVSHHVSALERELGQRLINRGTRPLSLTRPGELLHAAARVALAEMDRVELELGSLAAGGSGRVALGSVVTGLRTVVPPVVRSFRERFPDVELTLEETSDVLGKVRAGRLDIGIEVLIHGQPEPDPSVFASRVLIEQPLVAAVSSRHRLASRRRLSLPALRGEAWLLPSPARFPQFRAEVDGILAEAGVFPREVFESTDDVAGARLVAAGIGVAIVPGVISAPIPGVALVPLSPRRSRRLVAVTVAGVQTAPVRALLDELVAVAPVVQAAGVLRER